MAGKGRAASTAKGGLHGTGLAAMPSKGRKIWLRSSQSTGHVLASGPPPHHHHQDARPDDITAY